MKVLVVGAGIAGLSLAIALGQTAHRVTVVDAAPQLAELGAGVQMTPQAVKYLFRWGLKGDILSKCVCPREMVVRDAGSGDVVGRVRVERMEEHYGAPYIVIHRAVLHSILHKHAVAAGAEILLDCRVVRYGFGNGSVELHNEARLEGDLVVAADGINSFARSELLGPLDPGSQSTGWAAFRMMAEVSKLKADPLASSVMDLKSGSSNFWIAPDVSCMTYLVKDATMLNIVLSHRDNIDTRHFTLDDYKRELDRLFGDFEPVVRRILDLSLPNIVNYPVYAVPPLPHWAHPSGRFTLVGDAAHAMAFYMSMGVSLAVEDAVALAKVLDLACPAASERDSPGVDKLKSALETFQSVRKQRAQAVQQASLHGGNSLHVPEGGEREVLYEALSHTHEDIIWPPENVNGGDDEKFVFKSNVGDQRLGPGGITDKGTRDWCYAYDAEADVTMGFRVDMS